MKTDDIPNIPLWQQVAASEVQAIMQCWGCKTLSLLHKDGILDYTTLKKLDPAHLNPTLTLPAVTRMFTKLSLVADHVFEGERLAEIQAQLSTSLMQVSKAALTLKESDLKKIERRRKVKAPRSV